MVNTLCEQSDRRRIFQARSTRGMPQPRNTFCNRDLVHGKSGRRSGSPGINFMGSNRMFRPDRTSSERLWRRACLAGYGKSSPVAGNDRFASGRQNPEIIVETYEFPVVEL